jgi:kynurenine formamidase
MGHDRRPRIVDLTLPIESGMPGIPTIAFYEKHPVRVRFTLIALPLPLKGMDGSPARVVGIESEP